MLPNNLRTRKIEGIENILQNMKTIRAEWQKEAEEPGAQPHSKFPLTCIKFMIQLTQEWLETEGELLEVETLIRKSSKPKRKS